MRIRSVDLLFAASLLTACSAESALPSILSQDMMPATADFAVADLAVHVSPFDLQRRDLASNDDLSGFDLAGVPVHEDMSHPTTDMAEATTGDGCDLTANCYGTCFLISNTQNEYNFCVALDCDPYASSNGEQLLSAAFQCATNYCTDQIAGGVSRCTSANDTHTDCVNCMNNAIAGLLYLDCENPHDPACNTSVCAAAVTDCHDDTAGE